MDFAHLRTCPRFLGFLLAKKVWLGSMHYFLTYRANTHTQTHRQTDRQTDRQKKRKHNLHQEILGGDNHCDYESKNVPKTNI